MDGLTVGRMVHFVDPTGDHCAAIVTKVLNKERGMVNLRVFPPETGDVCPWIDVPFSAAGKKMTWHWIERA